ncbi:MAG: hypothetical protein ACRDRG_01390 [Pseudonocardiaceae bacterium]
MRFHATMVQPVPPAARALPWTGDRFGRQHKNKYGVGVSLVAYQWIPDAARPRRLAAFTANDAGEMDQLLAPGFTAHGLPPRTWRRRDDHEGQRSPDAHGTARLPL